MARKTIEVGKILKLANHFLANPNSTPDQREGVCAMIETVLFETGNYSGYRYLDTDEVAGSGTRRYYFPAAKIQADFDAPMDRIIEQEA